MKITIYGTKGQYYLPLSLRLLRIVLNWIKNQAENKLLNN